MKKALSLILAMILCVSLAVPAFAAERNYEILPEVAARIVFEATVEIPNSDGLQLSFTNVYDKVGGEYGELDYGLLFGYTADTMVTASKDLFLHEITSNYYLGGTIQVYHYYSYKSTNGTLVQTIPAGTAINIKDFRDERYDNNAEPGKITLVVPTKSDYDRQVYLYPADSIYNSEVACMIGVFPFSSLLIVTNTTEVPSDWAKAEIEEGIASGLIPAELQSNYVQSASRVNVAQLVVNLIEKATGKSVDAVIAEKDVKLGSFSDTTDKNVLACNALGIINGTGGGKFSPDGNLTRAQFAAIISRVAGVLGYTLDGYPEVRFSDVQEHWVKTELPFSVATGLFNGVGDNRFAPENSLPVEQLGVVAVRALKYFSANPA